MISILFQFVALSQINRFALVQGKYSNAIYVKKYIIIIFQYVRDFVTDSFNRLYKFYYDNI